MTGIPDFDVEHAHKYFSVNCFNLAWSLIDKRDRSSEDDEQMIVLAHASLWHWTQRPDCTARNMSIGYWQVSRIYALLDQSSTSRYYANRCLAKTPQDDAFCMGYAYEALARADLVAGNTERAKGYLASAWQHAQAVNSGEDKALLVKDLKALE